MRPIVKNELDAVLKYLKEDVANCIYIYTDMYRYRLNNPNVHFWVDEKDGEYIEVVMKYHDSITVYARENADWDVEGTVALIKEYDVSKIHSRVEVIDLLEPYFEDRYNREKTGMIFRLDKIEDIKTDFTVEVLKLEKPLAEMTEEEKKAADIEKLSSDVWEVACLLADDAYYADSYTRQEAYDQLWDRITTLNGRSAIIRDNGRIIAHCSSMTEADNIAVSGFTISHKDYRGKGLKLGIIVENHMNKTMNESGWIWYGVVDDERRIDGFIGRGNVPMAKTAKLIKKGNI